MNALPCIAVTPGEPAGIGPDLCVKLAQHKFAAKLVFVANKRMLEQRAQQLGINVQFSDWQNSHVDAQETGAFVYDIPLPVEAVPGQLNKANAFYVLNTLDVAAKGCLDKTFNAMVTGPVQKSIINDAGIVFSGHTEYLADLCNAALPVMMLATEGLRVALVTTHMPISQVTQAITAERLELITTLLVRDLKKQFSINNPRILVCGLNPHAGEGGHLGREEIEVINPVLEKLRAQGMDLVGPLPADTLFTPKYLQDADAVLAMYHDQGLPVLKHKGFGRAINVTLGLPIVRTSVDHGTALELAGKGHADIGSMILAVNTAIEIAQNMS